MNERMKEKLAWWIVKRLPKRVLLYASLYAFCMAYVLSGEGPAYDGENARAYKLWADKWGLI